MLQRTKKIIKQLIPSCIFKLLKNNYDILKNRIIINKTRQHYKIVEKRIKNRGNRPIRYACYVMYASDFGESEIFTIMINDKDFQPTIVIVPDIARGKEHMIRTYQETKAFLLNKFGPQYILDGYDIKSDTYFDYSEKFDIIASNCPYNEMLHAYHKLSYLNTKDVLTVHTVYGYFISKYGEKNLFPKLEISCLWRIFLDTPYTLKSYKNKSLCHGKNAITLGYPKMDSLAKYKEKERDRKAIIIAPHHTVNVPSLPLSNFLAYYNLILELPTLFPNVDFIFRPHPLLFTHLVNKGYWTENEVTEYLKQIEEKGIFYSHGGDYFKLFCNSDAIIHDCGSYITEWLFTGKPCCFVAKDDSIFNFFTKLGKESIKYYKIAYSREQIIDFIQSVVDNTNFEYYKNTKEIKEKIMVNYPNVSQKIVDYLRLK